MQYFKKGDRHLFSIRKKVPVPFFFPLIFAFSKTFWSQSVVAEIYTLNSFFIILTIYILLLWKEKKENKYLYIFSFIYGLSLTNHHTMLLLLPPYVFYIFIVKREIIKDIKLILKLLLLFFCGLIVYLYLPICSSLNPPLDWGNPENIKNFIKHITRTQYGNLSKNVYSFSLFLKQLLTYLELLLKQFTPYITIFGFIYFLLFFKKEHRKHFFISVLFFILVFAFIFLLNFSITPKDLYAIEVFFIPSYLFFSVFIMFGLLYLLEKIIVIQFILRFKNFVLVIVGLIFIFLPLLSNYSENNLSKNYISYDYGINILRTIEEKSILFVSGDNATFIIAYLQMVEKRGRNIIAYDESGTVFKNIYGNDVYNLPKKEHNIRIESVQRKIISESREQVFYVLGSKIQNMSGILAEPYGILYKIKETLQKKNFEDIYEKRGLNDNSIYKDYLTRDIIAQYHILSGEEFYLNKEKDKAIKEFEIAETVGYDIETIQSVLSDIYLKYGLVELALKKSLRETDSNFDSAQSHNNLGNAYLSKGMIEQAIVEYKKALEINPKFAETYNNLGLAYLEKGVLENAIGSFRKAIDLQPQNSKFLNNLGITYMRDNNLNEAIKSYKKAIEISPNYDAAHYNLGNAFLTKELFDDAIEEYKKTIHLSPDKPEVYLNIGLSYLKKKSYNLAIESFEKAIKFKQDYIDAYYNLGNAYGNKGDLENAIISWKKALKINKNFLPAKLNIERAKKLKGVRS